MTVRESNCELFKMNYSEFEGLMNELGSMDWAVGSKVKFFFNMKSLNFWAKDERVRGM